MIPESVEGSRVRHPASGDVRRSSEVPDSDTDEDLASIRQRHEARKMQRVTIVLLAMSNIFVGMELSLYGPLFPRFAESKSLTPSVYALIRATYYLCSLLFLWLNCIQLDRFSSKHFLFLGSILLSFSAAVLGAIENISPGTVFTVLAFTSRIFEGIGVGIIKIASYMIVTTQFPSAMWTTLATLDAFFALGLTVGPIFGGGMFEVRGFSSPFYSVSGLIFATAILTAIFLPNPGFTDASSTRHVWNLLKKPQSILYFCVVFVSFYYTGFLEVILEPHLRRFHLRAVFIGLIFSIPDAFSCSLSAAWGILVRKGLNPVMMIFLAIMISIPSVLLIGPVTFIELDTKVYLICVALALKGLSQSVKIICSLYGIYIDTIALGLPNDASTHHAVYMLHGFAMTFGALVGSSTAGLMYDTVGFEDATLTLLGLEIILVPCVLGYGLLRRYRRPINFHSSGERRPLLSSRS